MSVAEANRGLIQATTNESDGGRLKHKRKLAVIITVLQMTCRAKVQLPTRRSSETMIAAVGNYFSSARIGRLDVVELLQPRNVRVWRWNGGYATLLYCHRECAAT